MASSGGADDRGGPDMQIHAGLEQRMQAAPEHPHADGGQGVMLKIEELCAQWRADVQWRD